MKKILSIVLMAAVFIGTAHAQISVKAGYGMASHVSKIKVERTTIEEEAIFMNGIFVGASYEFGLLSNSWGDLSIKPGLTYSFYGDTVEDYLGELMGEEMNVREARYEHYLDVPVSLKYSYNILPDVLTLSGYVGPIFSFGLAATDVAKFTGGSDRAVQRENLYTGTVTTKYEVGGEKISEKIEGDGTDYSMFDLKLGVGVSANIYETVDVFIEYGIGLLDRYTEPKSEINIKYNTNILQVGVAYSF